MKKTLRQQIDELAAMDVAALQTRHLEFFGKETTCAHRQFLFRKLAWHLQAKAEGGLPTRRGMRCAIYTRKSTEEGLEQEFNTLDAQRHSAEAYIRAPSMIRANSSRDRVRRSTF